MARTRTPKPKRRIVRLLPLTITMLSLLFVIKMNEVYLGSRQLREIYGARDAVAEEKKADASHGEAKKDNAHAEVKKDDGHGEAKKDDGHGAAKKDDGHGAPAKPPEEEKTFGTGKSTVKAIEAIKARESQPLYSQSELDLLQNLAKRRDELEQRERDLDIKAKVLEASEKRITDKIAEVKTLEADLSKVLAQYNVKQDEQIKSLVKIYESMKPDEAAAIFNELELPILLDVISKMSERKVALVLANMNPKRARDVTQELADRRNKAVQSAAAVVASAPAPVPAPAPKPAAAPVAAPPAPVAAPAAPAPTPAASAAAPAPSAAPATSAAPAAAAPAPAASAADDKAKH